MKAITKARLRAALDAMFGPDDGAMVRYIAARDSERRTTLCR